MAAPMIARIQPFARPKKVRAANPNTTGLTRFARLKTISAVELV